MHGEFGGIRLPERFEILSLPDDGGNAPDDECGLLEITVVHLDFPPRSNDNVEVGVERSARVDDTATGAKVKGFGVEFGEPLVIKVFGEQKEKAFDLYRCAVRQKLVQQFWPKVCHEVENLIALVQLDGAGHLFDKLKNGAFRIGNENLESVDSRFTYSECRGEERRCRQLEGFRKFAFKPCGEDDSSVCIDGRVRFARRDEMEEPALCQRTSPAKPNGFLELKMKGRKRSFKRRVLPMFAIGTTSELIDPSALLIAEQTVV